MTVFGGVAPSRSPGWPDEVDQMHVSRLSASAAVSACPQIVIAILKIPVFQYCSNAVNNIAVTWRVAQLPGHPGGL